MDSVPAMTSRVPSCSKRVKPFSDGGRDGLSRSSQNMERLVSFVDVSWLSTCWISARIAWFFVRESVLPDVPCEILQR